MIARPQAGSASSLEYAEQLHAYAAGRLDEHSLRCWIIGRLMLDEGLDHTGAEEAFEQARTSARNGSRNQGVRR